MQSSARVLLSVVAILMAMLLLPEPLEKFFAFVLVGLIPFTNVTLPPIAMLAIYSLLLFLVLRWILSQSKTLTDSKKRQANQRKKARQYVAKKNSVKIPQTKPQAASKSTSRKRQVKRAEA